MSASASRRAPSGPLPKMRTLMRASPHETEMEVLITVKAYPNPSSTYTETVCVAGIRLDTDPHEWVRLYPVQFRMLPKEKQFKKYDIVRLRAVKTTSDPRPESYKLITDSIEVIDHIPHDTHWAERMPILKSVEVSSMCELQRLQAERGTSLGFFKPGQITDFFWTETSSEWSDGQLGSLGQGNLLCESAPTLEKIPYDFRFRFRCDDPNCNIKHRGKLIDWEVGQLWRRLNGRPEEVRLAEMRARWFDQICSAKRDTYFYAGTVANHPTKFVLLGAVYPRKARVVAQETQMATLFDPPAH
jgi:hypothetical protein